MHTVGMMVLYSSSPPTSWGTQCSVNSRNSSAAIDIVANHRQPKSMQGSLSNCLYSNVSRFSQHASQSASDVLDSSPNNSYSVGSFRSSTPGESVYGMTAWENCDIRSGAANISASTSLKTREHSPVSVLHGPVTRSSVYGSPVHPVRESANGGRLPLWDSHIEKILPRRKPSFPGEKDRRMTARSVGFEVCNNAASSAEQQVRASMAQSTESETSVISFSEPVRVEGFGSGAFGFDNSRIDTFTLPLHADGRSHRNSSQREAAPGIVEARETILRMAEQANGLSSVCAQDSLKVESDIVTTADEILRGAQDRFCIFHDPVVVKAFRIAEEAHRGQVRRNGDIFLSHCMETALILAAIGVSNTVIAAGLLHDTIDDSNFSLQRLRDVLGEEVASLVIGVSKLSEFSQLARDSNTVGNPMEADRLRTMILAMVDVRVVLIKIADRLHNLRTLEALPTHKQIGIAKETLGIFAPLANRLGIWRWKAELEDLCFKYLKPVDHQELSVRLSERCQEGLVMSSIRNLDEALRDRGVQFIDLCGRPKNLYSVYKKMMKKRRSLDEILDVRGLRLIVSDEKSCYEALEIVHQLWRYIPGKSKDYIVESKPNGYKSLHTVVIGSDGYPLEVQIRTMKMHHQAEYGLAAHWRYKEDNCEHSVFSSERIEWARWVLTWHSEVMDTKLRVSPQGVDLKPPCPFPVHIKGCPHEAHCCEPTFKENDPVFVVKMEEEHIFVREMPPGSTIGDLLYATASHMDLLAVDSTSVKQNGLRVKVNHEFVNDLGQKLRMGDFVEVITNIEEPCGKIVLEFQREQLKRLYLDGGVSNDDLKPTSLDFSRSVAGM